ncbi:hypothetical protein PQQ20_07250 [Methanosarcina mazei]|nr:hypothetical protein [Methanosarcina mazei]WIM48047.1 hypothetical protein PQQ20_07250 [Methanosarcina mazei]
MSFSEKRAPEYEKSKKKQKEMKEKNRREIRSHLSIYYNVFRE